MAISTFAELKQAVQFWTTRSDVRFVARIPDFIRLGEQRIYFGSKEPFASEPVRVRAMETFADIPLTNGIGTLPDELLEIDRLYFEADPNAPLEFFSRREFHTTVQNQTGEDRPTIYTIENGSILVAGAVDGTLKMLSNNRFAYLVNDSDTNWLLENVPAIHLNAALVEAFDYIRSTSDKAEKLQNFISAANGVTMMERNALVSGQTLIPKARTAA